MKSLTDIAKVLNQSAKPGAPSEMSSDMPDVTDHTQLALAIGEMRGQVREMVHTQNNLLQQVQSMASIVIASAGLPDVVAALALRVTALEKEGNMRNGREGVIVAIARSPALGWVVGAITTLALWLTGKIHLQ